jgi:hypothetical protein
MDVDSRQLIAQWAYDTHAVLARFHLWLEDVAVERAPSDDVSSHAFTPRGITRSLAMTAAATALGTRLFGHFGEGRGADKVRYNQVKKAADAVSAYAMSEGLWHLTRALPENHAVMVSLGEGLMPKVGETPEMGANPLLGFGRVYARPEVARIVDGAVRRLLNDPGWRFDDFRGRLRERGVTVWGAAVDTLENTSRFAEGQVIGPMTVLHLFDTPLRVTRPYEAYMGCLTVPRRVVAEAARRSRLLDFHTPRAEVLDAIERSYPGIARSNVHVWTLRGKSRTVRLSSLWAEWTALGVHLVDDGWRAPSGIPVFVDSGTYAPTFLVGSWRDAGGATHVFLCDGYAASAEAMQAASLAEVLDVDATMAPFSSTFDRPLDQEGRLMRLDPAAADFADAVAAIVGARPTEDGRVAQLVESLTASIDDARSAEIPLGRRVLRADDLLPDKGWRVLAAIGYMGDDPYTGAPGVERLSDDRYRVTAALATRDAQSRVTFTVRLLEGLERSRQVWSPLLVRFLTGTPYEQLPVKISYSGRIRNELQTMFSTALDHDGDRIRVCFDRIDDSVLPRAGKDALRRALAWYCEHHPTWFGWLELA